MKNEINNIKKSKNELKLDDKVAKMSKANFLIPRLKAFVTDLFLINMPILYIVTYMILDGKKDFLHSQIVIFFCELLYCLILILFLRISSQTPGFKYAEISLESYENKKLTFIQCAIFIFVWIIELGFLLPLIFYFGRKDKKTLHEFLSKTKIVYKENKGRN